MAVEISRREVYCPKPGPDRGNYHQLLVWASGLLAAVDGGYPRQSQSIEWLKDAAKWEADYQRELWIDRY